MNIDHADLLEASGKYDEEDQECEPIPRPAPYVVPAPRQVGKKEFCKTHVPEAFVEAARVGKLNPSGNQKEAAENA